MLRVRYRMWTPPLVLAVSIGVCLVAFPISRISGWPAILILLLMTIPFALMNNVETLLLIKRRHRAEPSGRDYPFNSTQRELILLLETRRRADEAILNEGTMKGALECILTDVREVVPFDSAQALLLVAPGHLSSMGGVAPNLHSHDELPVEITFDGFPAVAQVCASRQPLIISETNRHRWTMQANTRSWMGVPLLGGDRLLGILSFSADVRNRFSDEHLGRAAAIANAVALAIEHSRLHERLEMCSAELSRCLGTSRVGRER